MRWAFRIGVQQAIVADNLGIFIISASAWSLTNSYILRVVNRDVLFAGESLRVYSGLNSVEHRIASRYILQVDISLRPIQLRDIV